MDALERGLEADTPYPRRARAATSRNSRLGVRGGRTALAEYAWGGGGGEWARVGREARAEAAQIAPSARAERSC